MTQFAVSALMRRGVLAGTALVLAATFAQAGECPKEPVDPSAKLRSVEI
jgi:hypothetical protein